MTELKAPKPPAMMHQKKVLENSWDRKALAILWTMGTGKSRLAIDTAERLYINNLINGLLVIAPKGCYANWYYNEIPIHMSDQVDYKMVMWEGKRTKKHDGAVADITSGPEPGRLHIFIINIEAIRGGRGKAAALAFAMAHTTMTVIDESTAIKNHKAAQTKACMLIRNQSEYRRIMSGTPITQSPLDVYSQFNFLGKGLLGFTSFWSFRSEYAVMVQVEMNGRPVRLVKGFKNLEDLTARMEPYCSRITKEQCLDLPPKTYSVEYVEMTKAQKQAYDSMRDMCLAEISDSLVTVTSALTALAKLQQIVCGHVIDDDGVCHDIQNNRVQSCMDLLDRHGGKAIIWCNFIRDVESVCTALSERYGDDTFVEYSGRTGTHDRHLACESLQSDGPVRWMVATSAAAKGLTLTAANLNVYYSHSFNLETYLQSQDRTHRKGQTCSVHNVSLVCKGTVDEKIVQALRAKKNIAGSVIDDIRMLFS